MSRRIVIPLDGSTFAEEALALALTFAGDGHVELVTAVEGAPPFSVPEYESLAREWANRYLDSVVEKLPPGVTSDAHVLVGVPTLKLEEYIEGSDADLVVMATHGRGPFSRAWLGSMADHLLRTSSLPLLLVHPEKDGSPSYQASEEPKKVLVPLDGSELAETTLSGLSTLGTDDVDITLLRIVQYPYHFVSPYLPDTIHGNQEIFKQATVDARDYLTETAWRLKSDGKEVETQVSVSEHPARAISEYGEKNGFDLIALASHGRGGVSRLALGSVADKVIRTSSVPVLIFRPAPEGADSSASESAGVVFRTL